MTDVMTISTFFSARRGTVLIIVSGLAALLAVLVTTLLFKAQQGSEQAAAAKQLTQARIMLHAACSFIQEGARAGWLTNNSDLGLLTPNYTVPYGIDWRNGATNQGNSDVLLGSSYAGSVTVGSGAGIVFPEAHGWIDVRDAISVQPLQPRLVGMDDVADFYADGIGWLNHRIQTQRDGNIANGFTTENGINLNNNGAAAPGLTIVPTPQTPFDVQDLTAGTRFPLDGNGALVAMPLAEPNAAGVLTPIPVTYTSGLGASVIYNSYDFNGPKLYGQPLNFAGINIYPFPLTDPGLPYPPFGLAADNNRQQDWRQPNVRLAWIRAQTVQSGAGAVALTTFLKNRGVIDPNPALNATDDAINVDRKFFNCQFPIGRVIRSPMYPIARPWNAVVNNPALAEMWHPARYPTQAKYPQLTDNAAYPHGAYPGQGVADPQPVAVDLPGGGGLADFTVYRAEDSSPLDPLLSAAAPACNAWFRVKRIGPARFLVTAGAGPTRGYLNWTDPELTAVDQNNYFLNDQQYFETLRSGETLLWYVVTWSPAVSPAYPDKPIEAFDGDPTAVGFVGGDNMSDAVTMSQYQQLWSGAWYNALLDQQDTVLRSLTLDGLTKSQDVKTGGPGRVRHPLPSASNVCGTITKIQRLRQEPRDATGAPIW